MDTFQIIILSTTLGVVGVLGLAVYQDYRTTVEMGKLGYCQVMLPGSAAAKWQKCLEAK